MRIPETDTTLVNIYRCSVCNNIYRANQAGNHRINCLVNHPPGSCCHFGEQIIDKEVWEQIQELLKNPSFIIAELW